MRFCVKQSQKKKGPTRVFTLIALPPPLALSNQPLRVDVAVPPTSSRGRDPTFSVAWLTSSCSMWRASHMAVCTHRPSHHHWKMSFEEDKVAEMLVNNVALVRLGCKDKQSAVGSRACWAFMFVSLAAVWVVFFVSLEECSNGSQSPITVMRNCNPDPQLWARPFPERVSRFTPLSFFVSSR